MTSSSRLQIALRMLRVRQVALQDRIRNNAGTGPYHVITRRHDQEELSEVERCIEILEAK